MTDFSHTNSKGEVHMVSVTDKSDVMRKAVAEGFIRLNADCMKAISENKLKKGDVHALSRISGINGAKKTAELIMLAHNIPVHGVEIEVIPESEGIWVRCTAQSHGKTGVEMEALTGVSVALLNIYDMCKSLDKQMEIGTIHLIKKTKKAQ
ncbi:MAG: cyclic pyranopterin monophosphate synthase MoaC [Bacteroidales bacterium]|jgi:cyclic pyranopterin phosphate synthase|nr:cyclic pyranopterin monophosphate synthase MoaC [Bacteroidales bacterium]